MVLENKKQTYVTLIMVSFLLVTSKSQTIDSLKLYSSQNKNTLVINIENSNLDFVILNKCFEFQNGGIGRANISIRIKEDSTYFAPIASFYTPTTSDCYIKLLQDSVYTISIDLISYFQSFKFNEDSLLAKIEIRTVLISPPPKELINIKLESSDVFLQKPQSSTCLPACRKRGK